MRTIFIFLSFTLFHLHGISQLTPQEYAIRFSNKAVENMQKIGVPASITLGQGILESASGNSYLAREGNNHFGIKCHNWTGKKIYADDDAKNECFRKYDDVYDSFRDHADFLRNRQRYSFLFDLDITDYKGWAYGLSRAGYATDPKYADKLISVIERYHLYVYDSDKISVEYRKNDIITESKQIVVSDRAFVIDPYVYYKEYINNNIPYVYASQGDNIKKLADELDLRQWQIRSYNNLDKDAVLNEGDIIYLRPKRWRAASKYESHTVQPGETMHEISQMYGIKLWVLHRINNMNKGLQPDAGTKLKLRR